MGVAHPAVFAVFELGVDILDYAIEPFFIGELRDVDQILFEGFQVAKGFALLGFLNEFDSHSYSLCRIRR